MLQKYKYSLIALLAILLLNLITSRFAYRYDLTQDKRYTRAPITKEIVEKFDKNLYIKVYLEGDFPLDFKRIKQATKSYLEDIQAINSHVHYRFINPSGKEETLIKKGLQPSRLTTEEDGVISESLIFPWAEVSYQGKTEKVPLLVETGTTQEEQLQASIENIEYHFAKAFKQLQTAKRKKIAILKGNKELADIYMYDFLKNLKEKYKLAPFSLAPAASKPVQTLEELKNFDLAIITKPQKAFSETEKLILDQYITNGGKTLWLLDNVIAEMDSLQQTGKALFAPRELNLTDMLFSYGVRLNYDIVADLYSSKIAVAAGNIGGKTQFKPFLWRYYPLVTPNANHPIGKNIERVNLRFPTQIDTLRNDIQKTILLQSSPLSKKIGLPSIISLESIADKINPADFTDKNQIFAVLLEGRFTSAYQNRSKAFPVTFIPKSKPNKMLVISDGDLVANQMQNGKPTRMDYDKWTGQHFGNKDFILNAVDYLLDDSGILHLRAKSIDIKLLNKQKIQTEKTLWQWINIVLPLLLLTLFGFGFYYYRKKKYT